MKQTKVLFNGCSYSRGVGLSLEDQDPNNFVNVFADLTFKNYFLNNISLSGNSNLNIFLNTMSEMIKEKYDYVFVCWTSYPRYNFFIGTNSKNYKERVMFTPSNENQNYIKNTRFTHKWATDLQNKFLFAHEDHFEILSLIKYISILKSTARLLGSKVYFINSLCAWDAEYFHPVDKTYLLNILTLVKDKITDKTKVPKNKTLFNRLTPYTHQVIDIDNKSVSEIIETYKLIHRDYNTENGIHESSWLNLYNSLRDMRIDLGQDNKHPGPLSHIAYGKFLSQQYNKLVNG